MIIFYRVRYTVPLYFSCHGIKDTDNQLYFATITTDKTLLLATGIESNFVNKLLERCKAQQKVLLLGCCYSGAYEKGRVVKADTQVNATTYFGRGSVVITASDEMQYSFEGDDSVKNLGKEGSYFTNALVEGLETGKADANNDGKITYSELYNYIYDHVKRITPDQTPTLNSKGVEGEFVIFKNIEDSVSSEEPAANEKNLEDEASLADASIMDALESYASEDYTTALSCLDSALKINPNSARAHFYRGNIFSKQKDYPKAIENYQRALEIEPNPKYASGISQLLRLISTYVVNKERGNEPAAKIIQKQIEKDVDIASNKARKEVEDVDILANEGHKLITLGKYKGAIEVLDRALEIDPNNARVLTYKGWSLNNLKKYEEAIEVLDRALEIDPNYAQALVNRGWSLNSLGRYEEAIEVLDRALEIDPGYTKALSNRAKAFKRLGKRR